MRHAFTALFFVTLLLVRPASAQNQVPIESLLPAESLGVVVVRNVPQLRTKLDAHPLNKLWNDESVVKHTAPGREAMMVDKMPLLVRERTGRSPQEVMDIATGQFAVAMVPGAGDAAAPGTVTLVDIGTNKQTATAVLDAMFDHAKATAPEGAAVALRKDDYNGLAINVWSTTTNGQSVDQQAWAIVGAWLIIASPADGVKKAINRVLQLETGKHLLMNAGYKQTREHAAAADVLAYLNLEQLNALATAAGPMLGVDLSSALTALGADSMRGAYVAATIGDKWTDIDSGLLYTKQTGLANLLAFGSKQAEMPKRIPADVIQADSMMFSVKRMWGSLKEVAAAINPAVGGMLTGMVDTVKRDAEVDIEKEIIDELGERIVHASRLSEPGKHDMIDEVYIIAVNDADRFAGAFDALAHRAFGQEAIENRKVGNQVIYSTTVPGVNLLGQPIEQKFSYVISEDNLLLSLGTDRLLEDILAKNATESIWDRADVKAAFTDLPKGSMATYTDIGAMMTAAFQAGGQATGMPMTDPTMPLDPQVVGKYLGPVVGTWLVTPTGQHGKTRLMHK